jgi:hypothetical protein
VGKTIVLPATQSVLPATQSVLPATQSVLPATQSVLPATQSTSHHKTLGAKAFPILYSSYIVLI